MNRIIYHTLREALSETPAVCLLGPRQTGKTTLALAIQEQQNAIYLDLESERDLSKLKEAELYLEGHLDRLVILDEVHRAPGLFPVLRGLIDRARRNGLANGRYLLLGSASLDLLRQSGESLAGRIRYLELHPFSLLEAEAIPMESLWLRGGFPNSVLAPDEARSLRWRLDFIRTYLERDIPQFGPRISAETLRRFWTMLAHRQGAPLNAAELGRSMGVDVRTINRYLDLLADLFLIRRLQPWHANVGKRLVKSPRIYLRDSGLLHALLDIGERDELLANPIVGASWEGFVVENVLQAAPEGATGYFYRTSGGAEIDLLLVFPSGQKWAIEVKRGPNPRPERGFYEASTDLEPTRRLVVYPGSEKYSLAKDVEAVPLSTLCTELQDSSRGKGSVSKPNLA